MSIISWVTSLAIVSNAKIHMNTSTYFTNNYILFFNITLLKLGAFIGGPIGGALMDYIGRKYSILVFSLPMLLGWITIMAAYFTKPNGFFLFYIGRTLTGIKNENI